MGRLRSGSRERGYILLDVLIGLLIAAVGCAACLGGLSLAARATVRQAQRVIRIIEERNEEAMAPLIIGRPE